MTQLDTDTVLQDVQEHNRRRADRAADALTYFQKKTGNLIGRQTAVSELTSQYDWSKEAANQSIADIVGDIVDPVQQVVHPEEGKLVGIIDYHEWSEDGCYGYVDYDDVVGKRKRAVCSQCVVEADTDIEVTHATEGKGTTPEDALWDELLTAIEDHYTAEHDTDSEKVEVGASLASGTTISGNKAFHSGNDGVGSGLDADSLEGNEPSNLKVPSGVIAIYSGAISDIPSGWTLCDGTDGTPNLQDNFVVGAGGSRSVNDSGGTERVTLDEDEMPRHDHGVDTFGHDHAIGKAEFSGNDVYNGFGNARNPTGILGRTEEASANVDIGFTGNDNSHENMPPFVALAYIMKV